MFYIYIFLKKVYSSYIYIFFFFLKKLYSGISALFHFTIEEMQNEPLIVVHTSASQKVTKTFYTVTQYLWLIWSEPSIAHL